MSDPKQAMATLLAEHEYITQFGGAVCICGHIPDVKRTGLTSQQDYHREHLAEVVTSAGWVGPEEMAEIDDELEARGEAMAKYDATETRIRALVERLRKSDHRTWESNVAEDFAAELDGT